MTPAHAALAIRNRIENESRSIHVFWCVTDSSRNEYCDEVEKVAEDLPILCIPQVIRGFDSANALMSDLQQLLAMILKVLYE